MILAALIALVARAAASPARAAASPARAAESPSRDPRAEAIRYANALTGIDPENDDDEDNDDDGDDEDVTDEAARDCGDQDCADDEATDASADRDTWDDGRPGMGADESRADDEEGDANERADGLLAEDDDVRRRFAEDEDVRRRFAEDEDATDGREAVLAGSTTGELAALEAEAGDPGAAAGDDVSFAAASAGAAETYESWMRHQRPSPWGRLDLGVAWRRRWSEPMQAMSRRHDEVWLVATWRR